MGITKKRRTLERISKIHCILPSSAYSCLEGTVTILPAGRLELYIIIARRTDTHNYPHMWVFMPSPYRGRVIEDSHPTTPKPHSNRLSQSQRNGYIIQTDTHLPLRSGCPATLYEALDCSYFRSTTDFTLEPFLNGPALPLRSFHLTASQDLFNLEIHNKSPQKMC